MKLSHLNFVLIASATLFLTGCFEEKKTETIYDVEFYKTHKKERDAMRKKCANNPGELRNTPNCQNVFAAEKQLSSGKIKKYDW